MVNTDLLRDIESEIEKCLSPNFYGNLSIRINVQGGKVRNVNYAPERSKKYE